jgi:hypothetical protein
MRSHFYLLDMMALRLSPRFFSVSDYRGHTINRTETYAKLDFGHF